MKTAEDTGRVHGTREGAVGTIVFENRRRLNALSSDMAAEARELLASYASDPAVRVVVMRGEGEKAFISGGDISKFEATRFHPPPTDGARSDTQLLFEELAALEIPLIAMIHGYCLGGGMGVALSADMRFGATTSQLGIPAAQRGLAYPPPALERLVNLVGPGVAKDMMYSGRRLAAEEALRVGLLNHVWEPSELLERTMEYADGVASNAPLSIRATKFCIGEILKEDSRRDHDRLRHDQDAAAASEDFREATRAFMEKRKPVFTGR